MDSFDEWKFKQNIIVNGLNAKTVADMDTIPIPWNNSQIHIPAYYVNYHGIIPEKYTKLIGTKINKLTILDLSIKEWGSLKRKYVVAKCKCDCGSIMETPITFILRGDTKSCGCLVTDICENHKNIVGKKFGRLTVLEVYKKETPNMARKVQSIAKCKCDCGNIIETRCNSLLTGGSTSCGCYRMERTKKYNNYKVIGDCTVIYGLKGEEILVDSWVYPFISRIMVHVTKSRSNKLYANIGIWANGKKISPGLHRFLLPAPTGLVTDHINRNPLDNRYSNLRVTTYSGNSINKEASHNKSLPLGVYFDKTHNRFCASITINGVTKTKSYTNLTDAIRWRKEMESKYYKIDEFHSEPLILPNGILNPKYPYDIFPIEFWRKTGITPFVAYRI